MELMEDYKTREKCNKFNALSFNIVRLQSKTTQAIMQDKSKHNK